MGNDFPRGCQVDYVLGHFTPEQREELPARIDVAVEAVCTEVLMGFQKAACDFNNK